MTTLLLADIDELLEDPVKFREVLIEFHKMFNLLCMHLAVIEDNLNKNKQLESQIWSQVIWEVIRDFAKITLKPEIFDDFNTKCRGGVCGWPWSFPIIHNINQ